MIMRTDFSDRRQDKETANFIIKQTDPHREMSSHGNRNKRADRNTGRRAPWAANVNMILYQRSSFGNERDSLSFNGKTI